LVKSACFATKLQAVPEALEKRIAAKPSGSHQRKASNDFSATEINWFHTNCYNLAVKNASTWPPAAAISLFGIVIRVGEFIYGPLNKPDTLSQIINHRAQLDASTNSDAGSEDHVCKCLCYFAITIICVAESRQCSDYDDKVCSVHLLV
jgi:hypothetical protein